MTGKTAKMGEIEGVAIEISSDPSEKKVKIEDEDDGGTPLRPIVCLKNKLDLKRFEETEDCFILDFDPFEPIDFGKLTVDDDDDDANEVLVVFEKGQVACRDYPHPRHLCLKFPFKTTPHEIHCHLCFCYVCDLAAPCVDWDLLGSGHCDASDTKSWKLMRDGRKQASSLTAEQDALFV